MNSQCTYYTAKQTEEHFPISFHS